LVDELMRLIPRADANASGSIFISCRFCCRLAESKATASHNRLPIEAATISAMAGECESASASVASSIITTARRRDFIIWTLRHQPDFAYLRVSFLFARRVHASLLLDALLRFLFFLLRFVSTHKNSVRPLFAILQL
jgi:hypothetical protein